MSLRFFTFLTNVQEAQSVLTETFQKNLFIPFSDENTAEGETGSGHIPVLTEIYGLSHQAPSNIQVQY